MACNVIYLHFLVKKYDDAEGQRPRTLQNVGEERDDVFKEPADAHGGVRVQLVGAPGDPALLALAGGAARHRGLRVALEHDVAVSASLLSSQRCVAVPA